jgi:hypothetical protein
MRLERSLNAALVFLCLGAAGPSCQSVPAVAIVDDAGDDGGDAAFDSTAPADADQCNPCVDVCPCTLGDTLYAGTCIVMTCSTGTWGGNGCAAACADAASPGDAEGRSDGPDSRSDGARDAPVEAASIDGAAADAALADTASTDGLPPTDSAASD